MLNVHDKISIGEVSKILGVSVITLRRWDKSGKLKALRNSNNNNYRYYSRVQIEEFLKDFDLFKLAKRWIADKTGSEPFDLFYCRDSYVFQGRISKLESALSRLNGLENIFPLIVAIAGEIGNNSFDHNFGNWPDVPGIFFTYNLNGRKIILADRGQGVLKTLKKVRPGLKDDLAALNLAFTEVVSGRSPESRGNGLKFVRAVIAKTPVSLSFQSGHAELVLRKRSRELNIKNSPVNLRGCLVLIKF